MPIEIKDTQGEKLLDVAATAARLRCNKFSAYRLAATGALPSVKCGGARLFYENGVEAYLLKRRFDVRPRQKRPEMEAK